MKLNVDYMRYGNNLGLYILSYQLDISFINGKKTDYVINEAFECPPYSDAIKGSVSSLSGVMLRRMVDNRTLAYIAFSLSSGQIGMIEIDPEINSNSIGSGFKEHNFSSHDEARSAIEMLLL